LLFDVRALSLNDANYLQMGMVEFIGLLKVFIIRGRNLAVRDVMSSDPYVVATLGQQVRNIHLSSLRH
jgi:stromal membrane-associated protein